MLKQITGALFFIERGWLNGNHFAFNGKQKVLIDTGYKRDIPETLDLISQAGVMPREVDLIINTHCHCDHIGANRFINHLSGCDIALHHIDEHFISSNDDWSTWWRYYDQDAEFFPINRSLKDGDVMRLDDIELIVVHAPGHGAGQICLYSPAHKFLISADAVWDGDFGVMTTRIEGSIAPFLQQQTLDRIAAMDIDTIYPGHGGVIYHPQQAIDRCRRRLENFMNDPQALGRDLIKKIILYVLLMKPGFRQAELFPYLMNTHWFSEVVDLYFSSEYQAIYLDILAELEKKRLVHINNAHLTANLKA